jgi:hypothetical protein
VSTCTASQPSASTRAVFSDLEIEGNWTCTSAAIFAIIAAEIEEGREHFKSRVVPALHSKGIYERALCDVILGRKGHIRSKIW